MEVDTTDVKEGSNQKVVNEKDNIDGHGGQASIVVGTENVTEERDVILHPNDVNKQVEAKAWSNSKQENISVILDNSAKSKEDEEVVKLETLSENQVFCEMGNNTPESIKNATGFENDEAENAAVMENVGETLQENPDNLEAPSTREDVENKLSALKGMDEAKDMAEASINGKEQTRIEDVNDTKGKSEASQAVKDNRPVTDESAEKEWLDILGNGLLKKKIIVSGKGEKTRPKPGNEVKMVVNGVLMDGTKLKEEELVFIHDDREVIQAFELAVALMELGEKSVLYTDAKYAYGPFGCDTPKIPKDCNITYTLEIVSITGGPDKDNITDNERIKIGDKKRIIGNSLFSKGDYGSAIDCYKRALKYLDGSANKDVIDMKVKCHNNLAAAQLKVDAHQAALLSCNTVLSLQSDNIKAMFRKSKCLEALGKQDEALKSVKEASMIDPQNKMVYNELMRLDKYVKKSLRKESDMYKRMVGGLKKEEDAKRIIDDTSMPFKIMFGTLVVAGIGILAGFLWTRH